MSFHPEYQLPLPVDEATRQVAIAVRTNNWQITNERVHHNHTTLHAKNNHPANTPFSVQRIELELSSHANHTVCVYRPHLATNDRIALHLILGITTILCYLSMSARLPAITVLFAGGLYFLTSLVCQTNRSSQQLINQLCNDIYAQVGEPVQHKKAGFSLLPSAPAIFTHHAIFALMALAFMLPDTAFVKSLHHLFLLILVLSLYVVVQLPKASQQPTTPGELPNLIAASAVFMYCLWPDFRALQDFAFSHHATRADFTAPIITAIITPTSERQLQELLTMTWLGLSIAFMTCILGMATHVVNTIVTTQEQVAATTTQNKTRPTRTMIAAGLAAWALSVYAQLRAITWAVQHTIQNETPYRADVIWTTILLGSYAYIFTSALWRAQQRRTQPAPNDLTVHCHYLARAINTKPPIVQLTNNPSSAAERTLFNDHVLRLSTTQLNALDTDERDALVLHELAHLKKHAGPLGTIELLSTATLCGRGILSTLIDTRNMEFEADNIAAQTLNRLGKPGAAILERTIIKLDTQSTIAALTTQEHTRPAPNQPLTGIARRFKVLAQLVFGDGVLWYQHPTMEERLAALHARTVCRA